MSVQNGVDNGNDIQFSWGKITRTSHDKMTHFYDSFTYDGVEYHKYDCVFISNEPELPAHIGKIIKIWEQEDEKCKKWAKRVNILWFFYPTEISAYLDNITVLEKEIFLASGEGEGLLNENPLEVVAGKVNVICTSKDRRNPQPSDEDVKMANYIFYRTFDVGSLKISDKIDNAIAGVKATFIFNRMDLKHHDKSEKDVDPSGKFRDRPFNKLKIFADGKTAKPAMRGIESSGVKVKPEIFGKHNSPDTGKPIDRSSTKLKLSSDGKNTQGVEADSVKVKPEVWEVKSSCNARNVKLDKYRVDSDGAKLKPGMRVTNISTDVQSVKSGTKGIDSNGLGKGISRSISINEKQSKPFDGLKKASPDLFPSKDKKNDSDTIEVTRRPEVESSKWFKPLPWDERIENAYDEGKLMLLDNLDPDYSKADVEDILYYIVDHNCSVRLIEKSSFTNPNYGQALVIFKTSEQADMAVRKLNSEFLLLPSGRPLLASKGVPWSPKKKSYSLIGGPLSMDKFTKMRKTKEEARRAASASHYSQHNTIEYEMAMEWMFLDHKSSCWWEELHKVHHKEIKEFASHLKTK